MEEAAGAEGCSSELMIPLRWGRWCLQHLGITLTPSSDDAPVWQQEAGPTVTNSTAGYFSWPSDEGGLNQALRRNPSEEKVDFGNAKRGVGILAVLLMRRRGMSQEFRMEPLASLSIVLSLDRDVGNDHHVDLGRSSVLGWTKRSYYAEGAQCKNRQNALHGGLMVARFVPPSHSAWQGHSPCCPRL
jgi:hypothetical protein